MNTETLQNYEPFSAEWEKEMAKWPKAKIVSMLADFGKLLAKQPPAPEVSEETFWSDNKVMEFVNWHLEVKQLDSRYELENQFLIDSFKNGDSAKDWHTPEKPEVSEELNSAKLADFVRWYWREVQGKPHQTTAEDIVSAYNR